MRRGCICDSWINISIIFCVSEFLYFSHVLFRKNSSTFSSVMFCAKHHARNKIIHRASVSLTWLFIFTPPSRSLKSIWWENAARKTRSFDCEIRNNAKVWPLSWYRTDLFCARVMSFIRLSLKAPTHHILFKASVAACSWFDSLNFCKHAFCFAED